MKTKWWQSLVVLAVIVFSWPALKGSGREVDYFQNTLRLLGEFFPPDFSVWPEVLQGLLETAQISVIATVIATMVALPLAVASSAKLSPSVLNRLTIAFLAFVRSIPSLIWALIGVAIIGPFPLAGVFALVFYSLGYLGKFFADALDAQDFTVPRYLLRAKLHPWQAFQFGIWPSMRKILKKHVLWMLEYNIRSASIIGYVGAGGLGMYLHIYQEYGRWDRFAFVILLVFLIALGFEWLGKKRNRP